jgi:hypothetical protein
MIYFTLFDMEAEAPNIDPWEKTFGQSDDEDDFV